MSEYLTPMSEEELDKLCFTKSGAPKESARKLFRENFLYLAYYILGYRDLGIFHIKEAIPLFEYFVGDFPYPEKHGDKVKIKQPNYNQVLIELPRSTFKSSLFTIAFCIWLIIRNREIKIGLGSWKHDIAKGFLSEVKSHLEENDRLKKLYPEIFYDDPRKESPKWTDEMIKVIRLGKYKENTIETFGIDKQPTSRHYDIILLDDVVNESNVTSNEIIQKVKDKFALLTSLLVEPNNPMYVIGTRYHYNDLYSVLEDNEDWITYKRPAIIDGVALFPERLDLDTLDKVKNKQGTYIYSCQYLLTPMSSQNKSLNPSLLKTITLDNMSDVLHYYGGMDIAFSDTRKGDRTAIIVVAYDPVETNIYVVDGTVFRGDTTMILDKIIEFGRKYAFKKFYIETIGMLGKILEKPIENKVRNAKIPINYELIKGYSKIYAGGGKHEKPRIPIILSPHLEGGRIYSLPKVIVHDENKRRVNLIAEMKQEMAEYPFGKHDDIIDALTLAVMAIPDFVPRGNKQKHSRFDKKYYAPDNNKRKGYIYVRSE